MTGTAHTHGRNPKIVMCLNLLPGGELPLLRDGFEHPADRPHIDALIGQAQHGEC